MQHEIVILSYNALEETALAIESVLATAKGALTVIDNASTDGSVAWLQRQVEAKRYRVILNTENKKYTIGYDDHLRTSEADVVTLFNNDCEAEQGWEAPLLDCFTRRPRAAIVTPLLVTMDGRQVMNAGGQVNLAGHFGGLREAYEAPLPRLWSTGAVFSLRMDAYRALGGFDRALVHYCSDSDLCFRAWLGGWEVWVEPRSVVRHKHSVASAWEALHDPAAYQRNFDDQRRLSEKWERSGMVVGRKDPLYLPHAAYCTGPADPLTAGVASWR